MIQFKYLFSAYFNSKLDISIAGLIDFKIFVFCLFYFYTEFYFITGLIHFSFELK